MQQIQHLHEFPSNHKSQQSTAAEKNKNLGQAKHLWVYTETCVEVMCVNCGMLWHKRKLNKQ